MLIDKIIQNQRQHKKSNVENSKINFRIIKENT